MILKVYSFHADQLVTIVAGMSQPENRPTQATIDSDEFTRFRDEHRELTFPFFLNINQQKSSFNLVKPTMGEDYALAG